ncbi:RNA polymerase sigma factor [Steroidobacter flavus]|uniref:RNA polymerase sigma factor n=1 Tax=Steroidobacter flavus TaxID=1842136 RepID=A0ABV8T221_9GAMM
MAEAFSDHAPEVRRFLNGRLHCPETAADITQETYLRLISTAPLKPVENLRAFIFRIARNLAIDHVRGRARQSVFEQGLENLYAVTGESPAQLDDALAARDDLERIQRSVEELAPLTRRVFELCRYEGLAHKEVAEQLGVSVSTVEKHMAAALDFLRERLER